MTDADDRNWIPTVGDCSGRDGVGDCLYLPEYWVAGDPTCHYHLHGCVNRRLLGVGPKVDVERIKRDIQ